MAPVIEPGQQFYFVTDENRELFTILAVSPYVPMVKIDGGWVWTDGIKIVDSLFEPADPLEEQLNFLGLN